MPIGIGIQTETYVFFIHFCCLRLQRKVRYSCVHQEGPHAFWDKLQEQQRLLSAYRVAAIYKCSEKT